MSIITTLYSFLLDKFVPFVILLGLLIFVHELGHFLVAKYFKVRVEVFSLGFGRKILKYVKGPTTYCVSLIPLGGYVKMFGDDPSADIPENEKKDSFSHKPVGQRIAIVLAGPLMNLFFAVLLFMGVGLNGEKAVGPIVGDVAANSVAWQVGFQPDDKILSINEAPVATWKELNEVIQKSVDKELLFKVLRVGNEIEIKATPKVASRPDILQWNERVGEIAGLSPLSLVAHVGVTNPSSIAYKAGLRTLDQIVEVNSKEVKTWKQFEESLNNLEKTKEVFFKIKRSKTFDGENIEEHTITLALTEKMKKFRPERFLNEIGLEKPNLYIYRLSKDSPAAQAGIQPGDRIVKINGQGIRLWEQVPKMVNSFKAGDPPIRFLIATNGHPRTVQISPQENTFMNEMGAEVTKYQVGIAPAIFQTVTHPVNIQIGGLFSSLAYGVEQTIEWTKTIIISFVRMVQAKVSPKNIGGVFTIGQLASETFKMGLSPYLKIMAIISINLFILNLLPIPVLDGGHLLFFIIEALRGAPLSMKKMEKAQQFGLILLMSLMAYAIFNDITRITGN